MDDTDHDNNAVEFPGDTSRVDTPPNQVLEEAIKAGLDSVVVTGMTADGEEYVAASDANAVEVLWHLERGKYILFRSVDAAKAEGEP